jgi:hypothetical protein
MAKTITVNLVDPQGDPIDVQDAGTQASYLQVGDTVEWLSGGLDVTLTFDSPDIFGVDKLRIPHYKSSDSRQVLAAPPAVEQRVYPIVDVVTPHAFRRLNDTKSHPVMIIGP